MTESEEKREWEIYQLIQLGMKREVATKVYEILQKEKDAIWQYLIDHTSVQANGYMGVQLYYRDRKDFERRVEARKKGEVERYDAIKKEIRAQRKQNTNITLSKLLSRHGDALNRNVFRMALATLYDKYIQKGLIKSLHS